MENKTSKPTFAKASAGRYLKYAIGEIVLVVIGILIALQINNWNEHRKSNKQINLLLNNLVEAINQDIDYLKVTASLSEFRSNSLMYLLNISGNSPKLPPAIINPITKFDNRIWEGSYPDTLNMDFVNRSIIYSAVNPDVVINKIVLDELKTTGLFSAIKNDSLKKAINTYYSFVDKNFLIEDWNEKLTISWREFLRNNYSVLTMELMNLNNPIEFVKQNEPVQIRMIEMISPARFRSNNASSAIKLAQDVIREINGEIKNPVTQ